MIKIKVSDVVFREDLYPRIETSATTVQKYAEDCAVEVTFKTAFPDVCPPSLADLKAADIRNGVFWPSGSAAHHYFKLRSKRNAEKRIADVSNKLLRSLRTSSSISQSKHSTSPATSTI